MDQLYLQIPCAVGYTFKLTSPPPRSRSDGVKHFMPLSPLDGANKLILYKPSFSYSPDTDAVISQLMKESRLTFRQRTGFESILRSGTPLPPRPSDIYRVYRHAEKARRLGMRVLPPSHLQPEQLSHAAQLYAKFGGGGRRTLASIRNDAKSAGAALPPRRSYNPTVDQEREKDRLAHRMATGKDPPPKELIVPGMISKEEEETFDPREARFQELLGEVEDRLDFVEQNIALGVGDGVQTTVTTLSVQIQELLSEMRGISSERTVQLVTLLGVDEILQNARERVGRKKCQPKSEITRVLNMIKV